MKIEQREIFHTNIVEDLKLFKKFDDNFFEQVRQISIEDLIYLKLFLTYEKLNKKFINILSIDKITDKIVKDVVNRFFVHFKE